MTPEELRKSKQNMFSERKNLDEVLAYIEMCFPPGPERVAAITIMGLTFNTTVELIAQDMEEQNETERSD